MDDLDYRTRANVSSGGELSLPEAYWRLIGLEGGGPVEVRFEDGELRISSVTASLRALQAQAARVFAGSGYSVDQFLAERRDGVAREEASALGVEVALIR